LEWDSFLWDNGVIRVQTSQHFDAKTEESLGDVAVDSEALELLRGRAGDSLLTNRKICEKVRLNLHACVGVHGEDRRHSEKRANHSSPVAATFLPKIDLL